MVESMKFLVSQKLFNFKPDLQSKPQRKGTESEQFWDLLGGKSEYPSQKITMEAESDVHLFSCNFSKGNVKVLHCAEKSAALHEVGWGCFQEHGLMLMLVLLEEK
ncbi:Caps the barbed end of actin filaments and is able to sever them in a calcium-dependent manner [Stylosanthes scabra]|uniref:Caps the barbed end of actin filaments and is able to sever them in a calcium-dependent manner n=1 Tax=Stylosanthes scabra TaxID=79078 RepID=A0ABU6VRI5_9FABA|nr:Caps the barbed end of actin filaments and is able to sever them in a calcium-dependent manner [Stylosanthes scabra]